MPEDFTTLVSTLTLGADHSMVVNRSPHSLKANEFVNTCFRASKQDKGSIEKFGLFSSDIDYNTYFPDVNPEEFTPEEGEFIEPVFRLLSNCIVSKNYMPTEFPADVLKASIPLLIGQTVNCDHETNIGNAIGSVKDAFWQEAYKLNGIEIPAGINGVLRIDGKANPRIARGINMDPPSIHSNSVTVQFEWKPSHNFESPYEFYDKLGTYDEKGEMVRRIATRIISYKETSLVSHGADPFAQKLDGKGHIINPGYADSVYNSFSEEIKEKISRPYAEILDFKDLGKTALMHNTADINNKGESQNEDVTSKTNTNSNIKEMNKELKEFLEQLFGDGMLSLAEGAEASTEACLSEIKKLVQENKELTQVKSDSESTISSLNEKVSKLEKEAKDNASFVEMGKDHFKEVKDSTLAAYKKVMGEGKEDANIITLIENVDSLKTLISLKSSYEAQLEEKFPLHCADCGSKNINRGSAIDNNDTTENHEDPNGMKNTQEVLDKLADK